MTEDTAIYLISISIILSLAVWGIFFSSYILARKYPKISREFHGINCHCKHCYPNEQQNLREEKQ